MEKKVKNILVFFVIFLLIFSMLIPLSSCGNNNEKNGEISNNNIQISQFYISGLKNGKTYYSLYKAVDIISSLYYAINKNNIEIMPAEAHINYLEKNYPFILDEMKGISASTGIKLERISKLKQILHSVVRESCTNLAATGNATKNNETFLMQSIDGALSPNFLLANILWKLMTCKLWIKENSLKYRYAYFGIPGWEEIPILNEKGLGWGGTTVSITEDESRYTDNGSGILGGPLGYEWNQLIMMNCKSVSEVCVFYEDPLKPQTEDYSQVPYFWSDMWCDKQGNILNVEMTHNYLALVYGNSTEITDTPDGILWHANHHQWLDPNLTGSVFPEEKLSSKLRAERTRELLIQNYGNITIDVCKGILRDHDAGFNPNKKDSGDICRHPDLNNLGWTVASWIVSPKDMTVYFMNKNPCRSEYLKRDFSEIFK